MLTETPQARPQEPTTLGAWATGHRRNPHQNLVGNLRIKEIRDDIARQLDGTTG